MDDASSGPCCICGATTTHRCGACAGEAGFDLFFCSREHQKFVWFAHKKVCGKNAKPFRSPGLTPEEVEYAKATAYRPNWGELTLGKHFEETMGWSRPEVLRFLDSLHTPRGERPLADNFLLGRTREYMRRCRSSYYHHTDDGDFSLLLNLDPHTLLGCFVDKTFEKLFKPDAAYDPYKLEEHDWSLLFHPIVIGAALWHQGIKAFQKQLNNKDNSLEELLDLQVTAFHPVLAALKSLRRWDKQLAAGAAEELGAMTCFKRLTIFLVDEEYKAELQEVEEWEWNGSEAEE